MVMSMYNFATNGRLQCKNMSNVEKGQPSPISPSKVQFCNKWQTQVQQNSNEEKGHPSLIAQPPNLDQTPPGLCQMYSCLGDY